MSFRTHTCTTLKGLKSEFKAVFLRKRLQRSLDSNKSLRMPSGSESANRKSYIWIKALFGFGFQTYSTKSCTTKDDDYPPGMVKTWDNHHPWWCRILSINSMVIVASFHHWHHNNIVPRLWPFLPTTSDLSSTVKAPTQCQRACPEFQQYP